MARIAYVDLEDHPELAPVVERMTSARRGNLLNIYRMLLNSPQLAESWFGHMNAVRWGTTLSGRLRELAIIRVGYLNDAAYIIGQHVPKLAEADGVSRDECDALRDWQASARFDAAERAALAFVDEVFLGSTAMLNTLLGLLNERVYRRGHTQVRCPLRVCVGASNGLSASRRQWSLRRAWIGEEGDLFLHHVPHGPSDA